MARPKVLDLFCGAGGAGKGRQTGSVQVWKDLMDMQWAKQDHEISEAIPPAYTQYIGEQLILPQID